MSPERTCIGCRARAAQADLLRCINDRAGVRVSRSGAGRGAWVHPRMACLDLADRRQAWGRALRMTGSLDVSAVRSVVEVLEAASSTV